MPLKRDAEGKFVSKAKPAKPKALKAKPAKPRALKAKPVKVVKATSSETFGLTNGSKAKFIANFKKLKKLGYTGMSSD